MRPAETASAPFEFATAKRVVFGCGAIENVGRLAETLGRHALLVTGRSPDRFGQIVQLLKHAGIAITEFATAGEPRLETIETGRAMARAAGVDLVIGIGGGSAIDAAKAVAALVPNDGTLLDYLEVVGRGQPLSAASLPCMAIPTTAGTGSEVTRNAVLTVPGRGPKVSLRGGSMFPSLALVDPLLTLGLPRSITASTGIDALTQLIEAYVSRRANAMTDGLCTSGIRLAAGSLRRACRDGSDRAAREAMSLASLWSGMALANAGLGAVHGLASPIGGMFDAPHGAVCAALLPHVIAANVHALDATAAAGTAVSGLLRRFETVARLLTDSPTAVPQDAVTWLAALVRDLEVPSLSAYGVDTGDIREVVDHASRASSMKGNPVELTPVELADIVSAAL